MLPPMTSTRVSSPAVRMRCRAFAATCGRSKATASLESRRTGRPHGSHDEDPRLCWVCAREAEGTNDGRDAWFVGYSSNLLALVWVGFDGGDAHGLSGAQAALPIWADFM